MLVIVEEEHGAHRTGSSFAAFFNIVCVVAGTGVLALPKVLADGGWWALTLFVVTAGVSIVTSILLIECLYYKEGSRLEEFPDIAEVAFGRVARNFTKFFHYSISLSSGCIYILLSGLHTHEMLTSYAPSINLSPKFWIGISGIIVGVPFAMLKTLKEVTLLGVFGAFTTLVSVLCVAIQGGFTYANSTTSPIHQDFIAIGFPTAFATVAFSYGGTVVFPHVEGTMHNPKAWNRTLVLAIVAITSMYMLMAISGYLYYGQAVIAPVFKSMGKNIGSALGMVLITIHVLLAAPIYLCSFSLEQERVLNFEAMHPQKQFLARICFRGAIAVALTLTAMYIPYFKPLMAVFGAVSNSIIIFIIPVACHYKLFGSRNRSIFAHLTSIIILLFGIFGLFVGSFYAFKELIDAIKLGKTQ
ncbi:hypothetical protein L0F63_002179 [Massospora cicadina]|nr:hypothetical protein L0F63_002179 [Massospora cicadina]